MASLEAIRYHVPDSKNAMAFVAVIYFENPESLGFEAVDKYVSADINLGSEWDVPWKGARRRELNLAAEHVHFFALSATSQTAVVRQFLRKCLEQVGHEKGKRAGNALVRP